MPDHPLAFFLTWVCYGTWLHGDERESVDKATNQFGEPRLPFNPAQKASRHKQLAHPPYSLGPRKRGVTFRTIQQVCEHRKWRLMELNVRTNHVHVVVSSAASADKTLADLKAWCTRRLREAGLLGKQEPAWAEEGSTIWLWTDEQVAEKRRYVRDEQGPDLLME
ncbi:MAG: transposase [Planctomycetes bacterium]|nr:transposase [Planctomycetota bacterium]